MKTERAPAATSDHLIDSTYAWWMVVAAFIVGFIVFGVIYSFAVFLQPMTAEFGSSRAAVSVYFSIASLAFYLLGPFTGYLSDRLGPKPVVASGALCLGAGLMSTAIIDHLWVGYLTYGIGVGLGAACVYVPTLANLGRWFVERRNTALGIAAAGTGCGSLLTPPVMAYLIERVGWRQTDVVLGAVSSVLLLVCAFIVAKGPAAVAQTAARSLTSVVLSRPFLIVYASWVAGTTALFVPFVFLPDFAAQRGADPVAAAFLVSLLGGVSIAGRLGIGALTKRFGMFAVYKGAVLAMGASYGLWLTLPDYHWLVVFAVTLGLAYGVRIALVTSVLIELFGVEGLGALLGAFFTATGIAAVLGPLMAGVAVEVTGDHQAAIALALMLGLVAFAIVLPLRTALPEHAEKATSPAPSAR